MKTVQETAAAAAAQKSEVLLKVKGIRTYFHIGKDRVIKAVDGVDFTLRKGRVLGIIGESGTAEKAVRAWGQAESERKSAGGGGTVGVAGGASGRAGSGHGRAGDTDRKNQSDQQQHRQRRQNHNGASGPQRQFKEPDTDYA